MVEDNSYNIGDYMLITLSGQDRDEAAEWGLIASVQIGDLTAFQGLCSN